MEQTTTVTAVGRSNGYTSTLGFFYLESFNDLKLPSEHLCFVEVNWINVGFVTF